MDKHTSTDDNTLMRVHHKGILCRKCNCIYPILWSFRDHLIGPPCLGLVCAEREGKLVRVSDDGNCLYVNDSLVFSIDGNGVGSVSAS